jgi:hypothetical protein
MHAPHFLFFRKSLRCAIISGVGGGQFSRFVDAIFDCAPRGGGAAPPPSGQVWFDFGSNASYNASTHFTWHMWVQHGDLAAVGTPQDALSAVSKRR